MTRPIRVARGLSIALLGAVLLLVAPVVRADPPEPAASLDEGGDNDATRSLPLPVPERPFLLAEAPRRYLPSEPAEVRVQLGGGGRVSLAVFRVLDPPAWLAEGRQRQGLALAQTPRGREAERLLASPGPLPRRGRGLELVTVRGAAVRLPAQRRGRVGDETVVYDSYESEETDVQTWGVDSGSWAEARVGLGRLPPGLFLVRVHRGSFAAAALLSVGQISLLVRRGDTRDVALVTDADGAPQSGVEVEAWAGGRRLATARTDARGRAELPSRDEPTLRFIAHTGDDLSWADVTHARLSRCDPLVYLGVDRPVFRRDETIHLRGHVRGCPDEDYRPLPRETVRVWPARAPDGRADDDGRDVVTDGDGNFVVELRATGELGARVRDVTHTRTVTIDARTLPQRSLFVTTDRAWAAGGQTVSVSVADAEGGWPNAAVVTLQGPGGRQSAPIGPGQPARFSVTLPPTGEVLHAVSLVASLGEASTVTMARTEVWTGARPELLHLDSERVVAGEGDEVEVSLRATDLGGSGVAGAAELELVGSDGNRPVGSPRWRSQVTLGTAGPSRARVRLVGAGPWLVRASLRGASASVVVWDRPRPPPLSGRGPLAVRPASLVAQPGEELEVELRLPDSRGAAWVTLEQGGVWASELVRRPRDGGLARVRLPVPAASRGMATVVAAWIRGGQIRTATATVEVETSRALALRVQTDRGTYGQGANARLSIEARGADGRPRDAVVSVWLSDAGYWDLGEDTYPLPPELLRLPGRSASAADGSVPVAYGAEEGRHVDAFMEWDGQREPRMTFRHAWGFGGDLVRVDRSGPLVAVLTALARAAGLARAEVCDAAVSAHPRARLRVQDLPWDMVALRVADHLETSVEVRRGVLLFECGGVGIGGAGAGGSGSGMGSGAGRLGGRGGPSRQERLEGTLRFIGLLRLGPDGRAEVPLALPDHPGRWRAEVLAIADDGGGDRGGVTVHTERPLVLSVDLPADLTLGDVARGALRVEAASLASRPVEVRLALPPGLASVEPPPERVTLDARGRGTVPFVVRAARSGSHPLEASARSGAASDALRRSVTIRPEAAPQPVAVSAVVGPRAAEIRIPLPPLASPATLVIEVDRDPLDAVERELAALDEPRWNLPAMRLDRLASLVALRDAVVTAHGGTPGARRAQTDGGVAESRAGQLDERITRAISSQLGAIDALRAVDDGVGWWTHLPSLPSLTGELAWTARRAGRSVDEGTWAYLAGAASSRRLAPQELGVVAAALAASRDGAHRRQAERLLASQDGAGGDALDRDTWLLRAALGLGDAARVRAVSARLRGALERALGDRPSRAACAGPAWFLCFGRWGARGLTARAARALVEASAASPAAPGRRAGSPPAAAPAPPIDPGPARALAARVADWLGLWPGEQGLFSWGSGEAEVVALVAALGARSTAAARFSVAVDGRRVGAGNGRAQVRVAGGRDLVVRFEASEGRAAIVHVLGELRALPPAADVGPGALARAFEHAEDGWSLVVAFELPRDTDHVELGVPIPAGVTLAGGADSATLGVRDGAERTWRTLDARTAPGAPRVELDGGALQVRWRDLRRGRHALRVPLVAVAAGVFGAAPAWLHTSDDRTWGVTRRSEVRIEPAAATP